MVLTIPSPTRAMTVSSPAPPTSRSMLVRTVTRETAISWIPSLATAAIFGVSMTFGMTDILTASSTSRPARSMAAARLNGSGMLALSAEIMALTSLTTLPPARKCASRSLSGIFSPALTALMRAVTTVPGGTRRSLMPMSVRSPTYAPEAQAAIQSGMGTRYNTKTIATNSAKRMTNPPAIPVSAPNIFHPFRLCAMAPHYDAVAIDATHDNLLSRLDEFPVRDDIHSFPFDICNPGGAQRRYRYAGFAQPIAIGLGRRSITLTGGKAGLQNQALAKRQAR